MFLLILGRLAKENIVLKVDDLKRKLEDIKLEVQESLKNRYIDFFPQYLKLDKLITDINHIKSEYDVLHNQIEREVSLQIGMFILLCQFFIARKFSFDIIIFSQRVELVIYLIFNEISCRSCF